jgi:SAM-dependent methyltransferase
MNWRTKAVIQAVLANVPGGFTVNEMLQRLVGGRRPAQLERGIDGKLSEVAAMLDALRANGFDPRGKQVFEIGTGWDPVAALHLAALGAHVTTTDLWRHVRNTEIVRRSVERALRPMRDQLDPQRLQALDAHVAGTMPIDAMLEAFGVRYMAPVPDDVMMTMPAGSFDLVFSIAVLEHVRPHDLETVMRGQQHVLKPGGLAYHDVGLGDHFAHVDANASFSNFLQFEDGPVWRLLGENSLAYHNRYRRSDFTRLFAKHGWHETWANAQVDPRSKELLTTGKLRPAKRFANYAVDDLATWRLAVVLRAGE